MTPLIHGFVLIFAAAFLAAAVIRRYEKRPESMLAGVIFLLLCVAMALDFADFNAKSSVGLYWPSFLLGLEISLAVAIVGLLSYAGYRKVRIKTQTG